MTARAEEGIAILGATRVALTFKDHTLWLSELVKEGDVMTFTFEEPWSVDD